MTLRDQYSWHVGDRSDLRADKRAPCYRLRPCKANIGDGAVARICSVYRRGENVKRRSVRVIVERADLYFEQRTPQTHSGSAVDDGSVEDQDGYCKIPYTAHDSMSSVNRGQ